MHTFYVEIVVIGFISLLVIFYFLLKGAYIKITAFTIVLIGLASAFFLLGIFLSNIIFISDPIIEKEKIIIDGKKQVCIWKPPTRRYQIIIQADGKEYLFKNPSLEVCNKKFKVINPQKLIFEVPDLPCSCFPDYLTKKTAILYSNGIEVREIPLWFINECDSKIALMLFAGILDLIIITFVVVVEMAVLKRVQVRLEVLKKMID